MTVQPVMWWSAYPFYLLVQQSRFATLSVVNRLPSGSSIFIVSTQLLASTNRSGGDGGNQFAAALRISTPSFNVTISIHGSSLVAPCTGIWLRPGCLASDVADAGGAALHGCGNYANESERWINQSSLILVNSKVVLEACTSQTRSSATDEL